MIFIAGVQPKTRRLDSNPRICPACGSSQAYLKSLDHYVSFFFIPVIPIRRGVPVISCENCGAVLSETGEPLWAEDSPRERRCLRCGRGVEAGFSFCPHCGTKLE